MFHFFTQTLGRLHPLLVHLPIGILVLAILFYFLSRRERFHSLQPAVSVSLLIGFFAALLSVITGYGLSLGGDYAAAAVVKHQWAGIVTVILTGVTWYLHHKKHTLELGGWVTMLTGLVLTGHWGGSLTHGEGYLAGMFSPASDSDKVYTPKPIPDIEEAVVYTDIIQPILEARCYSCHSSTKQKGKLRLDQPEFILKGGEEGKVLSPGNPEQSSLIERLFLQDKDEDHMPPIEKPQPGPQELALLHWWVKTGGSFTMKVKEGQKDDKVIPALAFLKEGKTGPEKMEESWLPTRNPSSADPKLIQSLIAKGWAIVPLAQGMNHLSANAIGVDSLDKQSWDLLEKLAPQLVELRLGQCAVGDADMPQVAKLKNLHRLFLENTKVTDKGLALLQPLEHIRYLNLSRTQVTPAGIKSLKPFKELRYLYLYREGVNGKAWLENAGSIPLSAIDTGGYKVPTLASDTIELTEPIKN